MKIKFFGIALCLALISLSAYAASHTKGRKPADTSVIQIQSGSSNADKSIFYVNMLTIDGTAMDAPADKPRLLIHGAQTLDVNAVLDDGSEVVVGSLDKAVGADAGRSFTRQLTFADMIDTSFSTQAPIEIITCSDTMAVSGAFLNVSLKYPHTFQIGVSDATQPNRSLTIKDQEFVKYLRQDIPLGQDKCPPNFAAGKQATLPAPSYPAQH